MMYTYSTVHPIVLSADDVTGITVRSVVHTTEEPLTGAYCCRCESAIRVRIPLILCLIYKKHYKFHQFAIFPVVFTISFVEIYIAMNSQLLLSCCVLCIKMIQIRRTKEVTEINLFNSKESVLQNFYPGVEIYSRGLTCIYIWSYKILKWWKQHLCFSIFFISIYATYNIFTTSLIIMQQA